MVKTKKKPRLIRQAIFKIRRKLRIWWANRDVRRIARRTHVGEPANDLQPIESNCPYVFSEITPGVKDILDRNKKTDITSCAYEYPDKHMFIGKVLRRFRLPYRGIRIGKFLDREELPEDDQDAS